MKFIIGFVVFVAVMAAGGHFTLAVLLGVLAGWFVAWLARAGTADPVRPPPLPQAHHLRRLEDRIRALEEQVAALKGEAPPVTTDIPEPQAPHPSVAFAFGLDVLPPRPEEPSAPPQRNVRRICAQVCRLLRSNPFAVPSSGRLIDWSAAWPAMVCWSTAFTGHAMRTRSLSNRRLGTTGRKCQRSAMPRF